MAFCAVRGATSVATDDSELIADAVRELLVALTSINDLAPSNVLSAVFSATADLHSMYPAESARALGWRDVPMLCVSEMDVPGSLPRCIRVLLHLTVPDDRRLRPVYLREARSLRTDLVT